MLCLLSFEGSDNVAQPALSGDGSMGGCDEVKWAALGASDAVAAKSMIVVTCQHENILLIGTCRCTTHTMTANASTRTPTNMMTTMCERMC